MFNVGDRVIIREWNDMEDEFGLDEGGDIECRFTFTDEMIKFCGAELTIREISSSSGRIYFEEQDECFDGELEYYSFSADMLRLIDPESSSEQINIPEEELFSLLQ